MAVILSNIETMFVGFSAPPDDDGVSSSLVFLPVEELALTMALPAISMSLALRFFGLDASSNAVHQHPTHVSTLPDITHTNVHTKRESFSNRL